jgi:DNA repair exonuclease SbcCD ATPase subunit
MLRIIQVLGILCLTALLINGVTMTQQMKKIQSSLDKNLKAVQQLNQVQGNIIQKNEELTRMTQTLDQLDGDLNGTIQQTGKTLDSLSEEVHYISGSLDLNRQTYQSSVNTGKEIEKVNQTLAEMEPHLKKLDQLLGQLSKTTQKDQEHMKRLNESTESLNGKIPGVK